MAKSDLPLFSKLSAEHIHITCDANVTSLHVPNIYICGMERVVL